MVKRDVAIEFDLESVPLEIRTDSVLSTPGDQSSIQFYDKQGQVAGGLWLYFWAIPRYSLAQCDTNTKLFNKDLPSEVEKVWKMTVTKTSDVRVVLTCNDEVVVDKVLSIAECGETRWRDYWSRSVTRIVFTNEDSASDYYFSAFEPGI